jgi:hypothetical protein
VYPLHYKVLEKASSFFHTEREKRDASSPPLRPLQRNKPYLSDNIAEIKAFVCVLARKKTVPAGLGAAIIHNYLIYIYGVFFLKKGVLLP